MRESDPKNPRAIDELFRQVHWGAFRNGLIASALLSAAIVAGSRRLSDFDAALVGYTFASIFAFFAIVYRYSVWLTKPPTRRYWVRGWQLCFSPRLWKNLRSPRILATAVTRRLVIQDFVWRRGRGRWIAHMLLASGCVLAAFVTFPLVFGWVHFEQGSINPPTYVVYAFGFPVDQMPVGGAKSWFALHALLIASFLVIPGVMMAMHRRMTDFGAVAVQRFARDFMPLIMLFAVAFSGLLLWVSYEFLGGHFYGAIAQFHAFTVIATLLYLPFGKLFHIFQRPASLGIAYYKAVNADLEPTICPVTGKPFAPRMHTDDVKEVLHEMDFDYSSKNPGQPDWTEISPQGKRMLIGRAHNAVRHNRFD
ncbi:hypothetical protein BH09SUM1_BH09SUM1_00490 [soil metagenome]